MSTQPPRLTSKAASKRRAANRRRNRELVRRLGALFFILIFVLGTVALAFSAQTVTNTSVPAATTVAGTTPAPGSTVIQATAGIPSPTGGSAIEQIVAKGDEAAAKNDWKTAAGFYKSAIALSSANPTLLFKYGKALGNSGDYAGAVGKLQESLDLNPTASFASEAKQLIDTWQSKVTPGSNLQVRGTVTGTSTLTATSPMTK